MSGRLLASITPTLMLLSEFLNSASVNNFQSFKGTEEPVPNALPVRPMLGYLDRHSLGN